MLIKYFGKHRKTLVKPAALLITLLVVVSILLPLGGKPALAFPQPPHLFFGEVSIGGNPSSSTPDNLQVEARIGGVTYATTNTSAGKYGYDDPAFAVPADDPETGSTEGGNDDETVSFYVEGVLAGTSSFKRTNATRLDLTIAALPTLAAPTNLQWTTPTSDNTPTFTWDPVTGAASYEVRVDAASWTNVGDVTTYTFTTLADGNHSFEVRALDSSGDPGPSGLTAFTISTGAAPIGGGPIGGGPIGGGPSAPTTEEIEEMSTEDAVEIIEEMSGEEAAGVIEEVSTEKAASIIEQIATDKIAGIIEQVADDKIAGIIEQVSTAKAASIVETLSTTKAVTIIEDVTITKATEIIKQLSTAKAVTLIGQVTTTRATEIVEQLSTTEAVTIIGQVATTRAASIIGRIATTKAVGIIEGVSTSKAAGIIERVASNKATEIINQVETGKAAGILANADKYKAAVIMDRLIGEKLREVVPLMSVTALVERLPEMRGLSGHPETRMMQRDLFRILERIPTEQIAYADVPLARHEAQMVRAGRYLLRTAERVIGRWLKLVGSPMPVHGLLMKPTRDLTEITTTIESLEEKPAGTPDLPEDQVVNSYFSITFNEEAVDSMDVGWLTIKIEKSWIEQNSIHKWSILLYHYDTSLGQWVSYPTKKVDEDNSYVYYAVTLTHASDYAITGSQTIPEPVFQVTNLAFSSPEVESGQEITISADVTNTSETDGVYVASLWVDDTIEKGKTVPVGAGQTEHFSFTITPDTAGSYQVRVERLFGSFTVTEATGELPPEEEEVTPPEEEVTPPEEEEEVPPPTVNWWLIAGITAAVMVVIGAVIGLIIKRRK